MLVMVSRKKYLNSKPPNFVPNLRGVCDFFLNPLIDGAESVR